MMGSDVGAEGWTLGARRFGEDEAEACAASGLFRFYPSCIRKG